MFGICSLGKKKEEEEKAGTVRGVVAVVRVAKLASARHIQSGSAHRIQSDQS